MPRRKKDPPKEKYFYSFRTVEKELKISPRTLQRWMEELGMEPLTFTEVRKSFLVKPKVEILREYAKVMKSRDPALINRYREAVRIGDEVELKLLRMSL